ncbi:YdeI/OmpD-associated family protein [Chryseobacterium hispalense]|uniref:YdeI/OmpD-associated family protein n=1 Tax=Chryseobacterium hispalense TaxID=1453492 RepID=UPI000492F868|nr:YdeI/OmpD-associated family protein [Chryseobacterium hispalense]
MQINPFIARIEIIGINPFVFLPEDVLNDLFQASGKCKSPIPVKGTVNGKPFRQNLMKYAGEWRLYINLTMLKNSPKRVGEMIEVSVEFDDADRTVTIHSELDKAIREDPEIVKNFENLIPSRKLELIRYINNLKTEAAIQKNIEKIIRHLKGEADFFGKKINNK